MLVAQIPCPELKEMSHLNGNRARTGKKTPQIAQRIVAIVIVQDINHILPGTALWLRSAPHTIGDQCFVSLCDYSCSKRLNQHNGLVVRTVLHEN